MTDDEVIGEALAGTQCAYAALVDRYQRLHRTTTATDGGVCGGVVLHG